MTPPSSSRAMRAGVPHAVLLAAIAAGLAGCAVGPDFRQPSAPVVADAGRPYTEAPLPAETASAPGRAGAAQRFAAGQDIPTAWWQLFHSEPLDALIRAALAQSPTLASAQAALRQAQENYNADAGRKLLPAVTGQLGATREKTTALTTGVPGGAIFNLYNASVNVSYTIDAFGAARRELEGLESAVDYQRFQVEAAYLSLTGNVVTTAIAEASLRAQLRATQEVVDAETRSLKLV
ncbi:MAG: TolC family protein, partial [Caldimonas sp.]